MEDHELQDRIAEVNRRWAESSPDERRHLLDPVGDSLMRSYEAPAPPVFPEHFENPNLLGQYNDGDFRIEMNDRLLNSQDPGDALNTYLHEYEHARQSYEITKSHGALAHESDPAAAEFEANARDYVEPARSFDGYWNQPLERDARDFASRTVQERNKDEEGVA